MSNGGGVAGTLFDPGLSGGGMAVARLPSVNNTGTVALAAANLADSLYRANAASGSITYNLPNSAAVLNQAGIVELRFKKVDSSAHTVTVAAASGETIDGSSTLVMSAQWASYTLIPNGTGWDIIARV